MNLIHAHLTKTAGLYPDKVAVICKGEKYTYQEINNLATAFGLALVDGGLEGRRVIILTGNSIETIIAMYGTLKAGGTFVIVNPTVKPAKLNYILDNCKGLVLVAHPAKEGMVKQAIQGLKHNVKVVITGSTTYDDMIRYSTKPCLIGLPYVDDKTTATLIYTSGSTGAPKGVVCPHHAVITVASSIIQYLQSTSDDIVLNVMPLSYGYGLYQIIMSVMYGGTVILEEGFAFPAETLQLLHLHKVTGFPMMSSISALILKIPGATEFMRNLRYITSAGGVFLVGHIHTFRAEIPNVKLYNMYGLTECARVSYLDPEFIDIKPKSVGKAISCCNVKIVDEHFNEVPRNTVGELVIWGDNLMDGYWREPEKTDSTFRTIDGVRYLFSGDCFTMDEFGDLFYVSRKDDLIKIYGHRISPTEVESAIRSLVGVVDVVVKSKPDLMSGNTLSAHIIASNGLTEGQVKKHCHTLLEPYLIPQTIIFWDEFPISENGKIDRKNIFC